MRRCSASPWAPVGTRWSGCSSTPGPTCGTSGAAGPGRWSTALYGHPIAVDPDLVHTLRLLVSRGADANQTSSYGESGLSVSSRVGRFDAVRCLLGAGADLTPLGWTALHRAVALGTTEDVREAVTATGDLSARDRWERTPWLLAVAVGDVEKVRLLLAAGSDRADRGRCGKPPLTAAVESRRLDVLRFLLAAGFDPNAAAESGETAVMVAVNNGRPEDIRLLVAAGARATVNWQDKPLISNASTVAMARLLVEVAGADLADVYDGVRRTIARLPPTGELVTTAADYLAGKRRRFGTANPERMDDPFWRAMVFAGCKPYAARSAFGETAVEQWGEPVWCYDRFGRTTTELPDGRVLQVAGEHEDHYDPDFCIYNDLTVHHPDGQFDLYGYPADVFPPTDFHTATLAGGHVYLIGNLGYRADRRPGHTPAYRLDVATLAIERVETAGSGPGWISSHRATSDGTTIAVAGGQVWTGDDLVDNAGRFSLDLGSQVWHRTG